MTPRASRRLVQVVHARFGALTLLVLALSTLPMLLTGCSRGDGDARGEAVDLPLMAYLSQARALHHEASVREADSDLAGALSALDRLTRAPRPAGARPEIDEVLADTRARMAELRTRSGDLLGAERDVEAGLLLAPARTYFRGHLLEVAGILEEARAAGMADAGKGDEATRARAKAVDLFRQAVAIQEDVIKSTLPDASGPKKQESQQR